MEKYIEENCGDIWFIELLDELANYGLRNTDRAMAFGICLIHNIDNYRTQASKKDEETVDIGFNYYKLNSRGIPVKI